LAVSVREIAKFDYAAFEEEARRQCPEY